MAAIKMLAPSGRLEDVEAVSATTVKNSFGEVLDKAVERGIVAITRHDKARVVMLSLNEYEALVKRAGDPLERLHGYFDEVVSRMQGPGTDKALKELFAVGPKAGQKSRKAPAAPATLASRRRVSRR